MQGTLVVRVREVAMRWVKSRAKGVGRQGALMGQKDDTCKQQRAEQSKVSPQASRVIMKRGSTFITSQNIFNLLALASIWYLFYAICNPYSLPFF